MKVIEKIALIIYSNIILILSVVACLTVFGWIDIEIIERLIKRVVIGETSSKIVLGVSLFFILLSIRCIFFDPVSKKQQKEKQGILLANENGKLMISKETIKNLVEGVTKEYNMAQDINTRIELNRDSNLSIFVSLVVGADVVIKDLSAEIQSKIKTKIKDTTDLDVKEVNITVKKAIQEKQQV